MENLSILVQTIIGFGALGAGFKGADWLISLKYMTKDDCNKCRAKITSEHNSDVERLVRMETKMDMLLQYNQPNNYDNGHKTN